MQINSDYILIDTKQSLDLALINLKSSPVLSIDTESSGYYTYYSRICLIQITAHGKNYLIDTLTNHDLQGIGEIFNNKSILKIFHSATDDIKALKRDFKFEFSAIADTMISSKLLGLEHNSLEYLVEYYHKVKLSKTEQKSNWEKRPLDLSQLRYAAMDTAFLESIWVKMSDELEKKNMIEEALSEFEKIATEVPKISDDTKEIAWHKFPDILKFSPEERRNIYDILRYREEKAKKTNRAAFRIINNEKISNLVRAERRPEKFISLFGKKEGEELLKILSNPSGGPLHKSDYPKEILELSVEEEKKFGALKKWREKVMNIRNFDHTLMPSNKQLMTIAKNPPGSLKELEALNILSGWKLKNYGPHILKVLEGSPYDEMLSGLSKISKSIPRK